MLRADVVPQGGYEGGNGMSDYFPYAERYPCFIHSMSMEGFAKRFPLPLGEG